nr:DNA-directed RNA polymerase I subunit RPA43-like [Dasypus novemcinctus]
MAKGGFCGASVFPDLLDVFIAYDIKVVGELGDIYDDQGHIHLNIEADFVIFSPEPGQKRMGTVNKLSSSHIGCLIQGCFNASTPKPEQMLAEQWQILEINVGDKLEFEIFHLDSDAAGVFCIWRKLNITSLQSKCSKLSKEVMETSTEEAIEKSPKENEKRPRDSGSAFFSGLLGSTTETRIPREHHHLESVALRGTAYTTTVALRPTSFRCQPVANVATLPSAREKYI